MSCDYITDSKIYNKQAVESAQLVFARGFRAANVQPLHVPPHYTTQAWKDAIPTSQMNDFARLEIVDWRTAPDDNAIEQSTQATTKSKKPKKGVEVAVVSKAKGRTTTKRKLSEAKVVDSDQDEGEESDSDLGTAGAGADDPIDLDDLGDDLDPDADDTANEDFNGKVHI